MRYFSEARPSRIVCLLQIVITGNTRKLNFDFWLVPQAGQQFMNVAPNSSAGESKIMEHADRSFVVRHHLLSISAAIFIGSLLIKVDQILNMLPQKKAFLNCPHGVLAHPLKALGRVEKPSDCIG